MGLMMTFAPTLAPEHHCLWLKIPLLIDTTFSQTQSRPWNRLLKAAYLSSKQWRPPLRQMYTRSHFRLAILENIFTGNRKSYPNPTIWAGCTKRPRIGFWERKCARYLVKNPKLFNKNDEWLFSVDIFSQITSEFDGVKISDDEISTSFFLDQVFPACPCMSYYSQVAR